MYAKLPVEKETPGKESLYYILFLLQITGLAGIALTGDAFNLYVLIEVAALTGYGLIAIGSNRAAAATFNYLILGTIGASLYLLGVGYVYIKTGTLNMVGIQEVIQANQLMDSASHASGFRFDRAWYLDQKWHFSLSCLVTQCLLQCSKHHLQLACTSGDQGNDLCDDSDATHGIRGRIFL